MFYKPKSIKEYRNLLLEKDNKKFKATHSQIKKSKRILYCIHNIINYAEDIDSFHVFRKENKKVFKILFKNILKKLNDNYEDLKKIGFYVGQKYQQSLNINHLNKFIK